MKLDDKTLSKWYDNHFILVWGLILVVLVVLNVFNNLSCGKPNTTPWIVSLGCPLAGGLIFDGNTNENLGMPWPRGGTGLITQPSVVGRLPQL